MSILLVQVGDIHIEDERDMIFRRLEAFSRCVSSQITGEVKCLVLAITGDSAQKGHEKEFELAAGWIEAVVEELRKKVRVELCVIPGNHDCDFSGDQTARNIVLNAVNSESLGAASVVESLVTPLAAYLSFETRLLGGAGFSATDPFYHYQSIDVDGYSLGVHHVNSAVTSSRRESPGSLFFPHEKISTPDESPSFALALIHHPFNWFQQPDVMRQIANRLNEISDLVICGHEHCGEATTISDDIKNCQRHMLMGGALQERGAPKTSAFTTLLLQPDQDRCEISNYEWHSEGRCYKLEGEVGIRELRGRTVRIDDRRALSDRFSQWLVDTELPIHHQNRNKQIVLSDIYTYPDLREHESITGRGDWNQIRGTDVAKHLADLEGAVITGGEKSGKTSLAKSLFSAFHYGGDAPLMLLATEKDAASDSKRILRELRKRVGRQYKRLSADEYFQMPIESRVLLIDDFQLLPNDPRTREGILRELRSQFHRIYLLADSEFLLERIVEEARAEGDVLWDLTRLDICEFGYLKIEELTQKWIALASPDLDPKGRVETVCKRVSNALKINAVPQYPWIVIVLLQSADSPDDIAAKNGSYGQLYQAIITAALATSSFKDVDIPTKYTYLSELAYCLYRANQGTFDLGQAKAFHEKHCEKYGIPLGYDDIINDLIQTRLIRSDDGQLAFRAKFTFCFFVAWYIAENIHEDQLVEEIQELCRNLHHSECANIYVFLAYRCNAPVVFNAVTAAAESLFAGQPPAIIKADVEHINTLYTDPVDLLLPATAPDANLREYREAKDREIVSRKPDFNDGRKIKPTPSIPKDIDQFIRDLRAAIQTIKIIGQVLRNGVGKTVAEDKQRLMKEMFLLARRILSLLYRDSDENLAALKEHLAEHYLAELPDANAEIVAKRVDQHLFDLTWFTTYCVCRITADAVGHDLLDPTVNTLVSEDPSLPNRLFDLTIKLDRSGSIPVNATLDMHKLVTENRIADSVLRCLVSRHLHLYPVRHDIRSQLCEEFEIREEKRRLDHNPANKK